MTNEYCFVGHRGHLS